MGNTHVGFHLVDREEELTKRLLLKSKLQDKQRNCSHAARCQEILKGRHFSSCSCSRSNPCFGLVPGGRGFPRMDSNQNYSGPDFGRSRFGTRYPQYINGSSRVQIDRRIVGRWEDNRWSGAMLGNCSPLYKGHYPSVSHANIPSAGFTGARNPVSWDTNSNPPSMQQNPASWDNNSNPPPMQPRHTTSTPQVFGQGYGGPPGAPWNYSPSGSPNVKGQSTARQPSFHSGFGPSGAPPSGIRSDIRGQSPTRYPTSANTDLPGTSWNDSLLGSGPEVNNQSPDRQQPHGAGTDLPGAPWIEFPSGPSENYLPHKAGTSMPGYSSGPGPGVRDQSSSGRPSTETTTGLPGTLLNNSPSSSPGVRGQTPNRQTSSHAGTDMRSGPEDKNQTSNRQRQPTADTGIHGAPWNNSPLGSHQEVTGQTQYGQPPSNAGTGPSAAPAPWNETPSRLSPEAKGQTPDRNPVNAEIGRPGASWSDYPLGIDPPAKGQTAHSEPPSSRETGQPIPPWNDSSLGSGPENRGQTLKAQPPLNADMGPPEVPWRGSAGSGQYQTPDRYSPSSQPGSLFDSPPPSGPETKFQPPTRHLSTNPSNAPPEVPWKDMSHPQDKGQANDRTPPSSATAGPSQVLRNDSPSDSRPGVVNGISPDTQLPTNMSTRNSLPEVSRNNSPSGSLQKVKGQSPMRKPSTNNGMRLPGSPRSNLTSGARPEVKGQTHNTQPTSNAGTDLPPAPRNDSPLGSGSVLKGQRPYRQRPDNAESSPAAPRNDFSPESRPEVSGETLGSHFPTNKANLGLPNTPRTNSLGPRPIVKSQSPVRNPPTNAGIALPESFPGSRSPSESRPEVKGQFNARHSPTDVGTGLPGTLKSDSPSGSGSGVKANSSLPGSPWNDSPSGSRPGVKSHFPNKHPPPSASARTVPPNAPWNLPTVGSGSDVKGQSPASHPIANISSAQPGSPIGTRPGIKGQIPDTHMPHFNSGGAGPSTAPRNSSPSEPGPGVKVETPVNKLSPNAGVGPSGVPRNKPILQSHPEVKGQLPERRSPSSASVHLPGVQRNESPSGSHSKAKGHPPVRHPQTGSGKGLPNAPRNNSPSGSRPGLKGQNQNGRPSANSGTNLPGTFWNNTPSGSFPETKDQTPAGHPPNNTDNGLSGAPLDNSPSGSGPGVKGSGPGAKGKSPARHVPTNAGTGNGLPGAPWNSLPSGPRPEIKGETLDRHSPTSAGTDSTGAPRNSSPLGSHLGVKGLPQTRQPAASLSSGNGLSRTPFLDFSPSRPEVKSKTPVRHPPSNAETGLPGSPLNDSPSGLHPEVKGKKSGRYPLPNTDTGFPGSLGNDFPSKTQTPMKHVGQPGAGVHPKMEQVPEVPLGKVPKVSQVQVSRGSQIHLPKIPQSQAPKTPKLKVPNLAQVQVPIKSRRASQRPHRSPSRRNLLITPSSEGNGKSPSRGNFFSPETERAPSKRKSRDPDELGPMIRPSTTPGSNGQFVVKTPSQCRSTAGVSFPQDPKSRSGKIHQPDRMETPPTATKTQRSCPHPSTIHKGDASPSPAMPRCVKIKKKPRHPRIYPFEDTEACRGRPRPRTDGGKRSRSPYSPPRDTIVRLCREPEVCAGLPLGRWDYDTLRQYLRARAPQPKCQGATLSPSSRANVVFSIGQPSASHQATERGRVERILGYPSATFKPLDSCIGRAPKKAPPRKTRSAGSAPTGPAGLLNLNYPPPRDKAKGHKKEQDESPSPELGSSGKPKRCRSLTPRELFNKLVIDSVGVCDYDFWGKTDSDFLAELEAHRAKLEARKALRTKSPEPCKSVLKKASPTDSFKKVSQNVKFCPQLKHFSNGETFTSDLEPCEPESAIGTRKSRPKGTKKGRKLKRESDIQPASGRESDSDPSGLELAHLNITIPFRDSKGFSMIKSEFDSYLERFAAVIKAKHEIEMARLEPPGGRSSGGTGSCRRREISSNPCLPTTTTTTSNPCPRTCPISWYTPCSGFYQIYNATDAEKSKSDPTTTTTSMANLGSDKEKYEELNSIDVVLDKLKNCGAIARPRAKNRFVFASSPSGSTVEDSDNENYNNNATRNDEAEFQNCEYEKFSANENLETDVEEEPSIAPTVDTDDESDTVNSQPDEFSSICDELIRIDESYEDGLEYEGTTVVHAADMDKILSDTVLSTGFEDSQVQIYDYPGIREEALLPPPMDFTVKTPTLVTTTPTTVTDSDSTETGASKIPFPAQFWDLPTDPPPRTTPTFTILEYEVNEPETSSPPLETQAQTYENHRVIIKFNDELPQLVSSLKKIDDPMSMSNPPSRRSSRTVRFDPILHTQVFTKDDPETESDSSDPEIGRHDAHGCVSKTTIARVSSVDDTIVTPDDYAAAMYRGGTYHVLWGSWSDSRIGGGARTTPPVVIRETPSFDTLLARIWNQDGGF